MFIAQNFCMKNTKKMSCVNIIFSLFSAAAFHIIVVENTGCENYNRFQRFTELEPFFILLCVSTVACF